MLRFARKDEHSVIARSDSDEAIQKNLNLGCGRAAHLSNLGELNANKKQVVGDGVLDVPLWVVDKSPPWLFIASYVGAAFCRPWVTEIIERRKRPAPYFTSFGVITVTI